MRRLLDFFMTTLADGFFVMLPIVAMIFVLTKLWSMLDAIVEPLASLIPVQQIVGVEVAAILAVLLIIGLFFVTGLLLLTGPGAALYAWFERAVLSKLPGWEIIRKLTQRVDPSTQNSVVLVRLYGGEARVLGLVAEEVNDGRIAVFVPDRKSVV